MAVTKVPVSVQMYTVRDKSEKDFRGTLAAVAKIGFKAVELAGTFGMAAADLKSYLDSLGLRVSGTHTGIDQLEGDNFQKTVDYYRTVGCKFIVCPWWPKERRQTLADWQASSRLLDTIGGRLREAGFVFCYHNHDFEFQKVGDQTGWELLFGGTNPQNLGSEMDVFWIRFAGLDPTSLIRQYAGRVHLLHVKDMAAGPEKKFANVGTGIIDWQPTLKTATECGTSWFVIEQDNTYGQDSLEAVKVGLDNLKKLGWA
jgi:sugar phosphate isomerase/epimerase